MIILDRNMCRMAETIGALKEKPILFGIYEKL